MDPYEFVTTTTAIAIAIAQCVSKEEVPVIAAALSNIANALGAISVKREALSKANEELIPTTPPEEIIEG
jgi:hypothetical protein